MSHILMAFPAPIGGQKQHIAHHSLFKDEAIWKNLKELGYE